MNETINNSAIEIANQVMPVIIPKPVNPMIIWIVGLVLIFIIIMFLIFMIIKTRKAEPKVKAVIKPAKQSDTFKKFKWLGWFRKKEYNTAKDIVADALKSIQKRNLELFELNKTLLDENAKLNAIKSGQFNVKSSAYFDRLSFMKRYFQKRKLKKHPERSILIRMEMNNGRHREFIMHEDIEKSGFKYNKGRYIFDLDKKYYILDSNIWAYDFHESFSLAIERRIPVDELKHSMELADSITEVNHATNPKNLENFIISEIAQGIMKGAGLGVLFKMMLIIIIGIAIFILADFGIDIYDSGIIERLKK